MSPQDIAQFWHNNLPNEENNKQNEGAIVDFTNQMANPVINGIAIALNLEKKIVVEDRYNKPISDNLLWTHSDKLKQAYGIVSNRHKPQFAFVSEGEYEGNLIIRHPPLVFEKDDHDLLSSIIHHEVGHAADWAEGDYEESSSAYGWHTEEYAKNLNEAKQYADQLRYLLKKMGGDTEKVIKALEGQKATPAKINQLQDKLKTATGLEKVELQNQIKMLLVQPQSPLRLNSELLPVAKAFLSIYKSKNESIASKMAGPLLTAASFLSPTVSLPASEPVNIAWQEKISQEAANCVVRIINLLKFGRFVGR